MKRTLLTATLIAALLTDCTHPNVPHADGHQPGLWLTRADIEALPTEGESFENVVRWANAGWQANISDQNNRHNTQTYAAALLCVRGVGVDRAYCDQALQGIVDAIGTEAGGRTLALGRNLLAYVLAADLIGFRDPEFMTWLDVVRHKTLQGRTLISTHEDRPNNWGNHAGASRIAASAYLSDAADVEAAAQVFQGWLGNRGIYSEFVYSQGLGWQIDPEAPVGINPPGATWQGHDMDGSFPEEMRRCGDGNFHWPPCKTGYTWEALQGAVVQAELLARLGYPAWEWESQAILRAVNWLYNTTFDDGENDPAVGDDRWLPWLINFACGTDFPAERATQPGKNLGFADWTHGNRTRSGP